jgi:hypothetical protein
VNCNPYLVDGNEEQIAAAGAVRAVVMMMGRDMHNARSQHLGCKVLANLAANHEVRLWIGVCMRQDFNNACQKMKGISRVVESLQKHTEGNPEVVIECCRALTNLSYQSRLNKMLIMNENAINHICEALRRHKDNATLINECLRTLRNLVSHLGELLLSLVIYLSRRVRRIG